MGRLAAILAMLAIGAVPAAPAAAGDLPRVASFGLCADHYVLALADPSQIVSLSHHAAGPLSVNRDRAAAFPANRGSAEELLMVGAEVVVLQRWGTAETAAHLTRQGVAVVPVGDDLRLTDAVASIRRVGAAIGRPGAAATWADALAARSAATPPPGPVAAYFRPDGGSAGANTFVDDAMTAAGLANLKAELGESGWRRLDLEALVMTPPVLMVFSFFDTSPPSLGGSFTRHPVFRRFAADRPVFGVPGAYWPCAGPHLGDAIDHLAGALGEISPVEGAR